MEAVKRQLACVLSQSTTLTVHNITHTAQWQFDDLVSPFIILQKKNFQKLSTSINFLFSSNCDND